MRKDDSTWRNLAYVFFFVLFVYVGNRALETLGIQFGWGERYDWFATAKIVAGLVVGSAMTYWLVSSAERREFHLQAIGELRRVTWPSFDDTKKMTIIVAVVVAIFSVILFVFDVLWSKVLQAILQ
jgi:preprotein translocase SecE subunit